MITAFICFVIVVAMFAAGNNGEWGSVAVGGVIIVLAIGLSCAGRSTDRAVNNCVDYWEKGGPNRRR